MDESAQRALEYLTEVEVTAEDILADKQQIVDLDVRRNRNREALNSLRKHSANNKVQVCFGNMFIRFPPEETRCMISKDQEQLDKEINDLRQRLKAKVYRLNELQGKPELRGYHLSPLNTDELKAINALIKK